MTLIFILSPLPVYRRLLDGQVAARDFLAERTVVSKEALAGLLTQQTSANHLLQQRMRAILCIAGLAVQRFHDSQVYIVTNQVAV